MNRVEGPVLELQKVRRGEAGSYLCIASNGHPPTVSRRLQLDVKCKTLVLNVADYYFYSTLPSPAAGPRAGAEGVRQPRAPRAARVQRGGLPAGRGHLGVARGEGRPAHQDRVRQQVRG